VPRSEYAPASRGHGLPRVGAQARHRSVNDGPWPVANQPRLCWQLLRSKLCTERGLGLAAFSHDLCFPIHISSERTIFRS
jgi:hypothetical protein